MTPNNSSTINWLTTIAIAAVAVSATVGFHESVHAITCLFGGELLEFSALHVDCAFAGEIHRKIVAGSASIANMILGAVCLVLLRRARGQSSAEWQFFLWLFMLMNWLNGAGYWMFSGIGNVGDWAAVIEGWEPHWLWRVGMALVGTAFYTFFVWFALKELGKIIGGTADEQIGRAVKLGLIAYGTAAAVIALAGFFNPYGPTSLPVIAGLIGILFGFSPLIWMMQWFRAEMFEKAAGTPLTISHKTPWLITALVIVSIYAFVLGPTLYF